MAAGVDKEKKRCTSVCKEFAKLNAFPAFETYGNIVRVIVGKGKRQRDFSVHKGLICAASSYFHAAFNGNFKEGIEGTVHLDEDSPNVFADFLTWLYTRNLPEPGTSGLDVKQDRMIKLHIFADARGIKALKIATIDVLCDEIAQSWVIPCSSLVDYAYANTVQGSGLRKLMVDVVLQTQSSIRVHYSATEAVDFVMDYALALETPWKRRRISREEWRKVDRCAYHEHHKDKKSP